MVYVKSSQLLWGIFLSRNLTCCPHKGNFRLEGCTMVSEEQKGRQMDRLKAEWRETFDEGKGCTSRLRRADPCIMSWKLAKSALVCARIMAAPAKTLDWINKRGVPWVAGACSEQVCLDKYEDSIRLFLKTVPWLHGAFTNYLAVCTHAVYLLNQTANICAPAAIRCAIGLMPRTIPFVHNLKANLCETWSNLNN